MTKQAASLGNLDDVTRVRWLDRPQSRAVHIQRTMTPPEMMVRQLVGQNASEVPFAEDDDVREALAADTADQPLGPPISKVRAESSVASSAGNDRRMGFRHGQLALANSSKAKEVFITMDCCHSGAFGVIPEMGADKVILRDEVSVITAARADHAEQRRNMISRPDS